MKNKKKEAESANIEMDQIFNGEKNEDTSQIVPILSDNTRLAIIDEQDGEKNT